jgi:hypothetical protein
MRRLEDRPYWELSFDEDGRMTAPPREEFLTDVAREAVTDLYVLSHGWGTSEEHARHLYEYLVPQIARAAQGRPGHGPVGFAGILWPSIWFPDPPAERQQERGAALSTDSTTVAEPDFASWTGKAIADTLQDSFPDRRDTVTALGQLIDDGSAAAAAGTEPDEVQEQRLIEFHARLQTLLPASGITSFEDNGETALLRIDNSGELVNAYAQTASGLGGGTATAATLGLTDTFKKVWNGAKDALRVASYYTMKARAGQIGQMGLGPLLETLAARMPGIRVHLLGHSFGARLVSFALAGLTSAAASPVASLVLVQGAFSHWAFAHKQDSPFGAPGALHQFADRVHGPLVATFTPHDWAVGRWYPQASKLARQDTSSTGVARWGGMGSDGFQAVAPVDEVILLDPGESYSFKPARFYRINGSAVINNTGQSAFAGAHSDIRRPEIAWLAVSAAS